MRLRHLHYVLAALLGMSAACTLTVDVDSLSNHDCGEKMKYCESAPEKCVRTDNARYGCGITCNPCVADNVETFTCTNNGQCLATVCNSGFGICSGRVPCATDLTKDADNCGQCNNSCKPSVGSPHGTNKCQNGVCQIDVCDDGWQNCNGNLDDGCETAIHNDARCIGPLGCTPCATGQTCVLSGGTWACQ